MTGKTRGNSAENRESYHHGDLRETLIRAGLDVFDSGARAEDVSLRALARSVGVSATAVYRHFPDKAALLAALALAGLDRMGAMQAEAMVAARAAGATPRQAFAASGGAYVRFALANPEIFRLIWQKAPEGDMLTAPPDHAHEAMLCLREGIASVLPENADSETRRINALKAWGLVHGLAMLALDKQIVLDDATIDGVLDALDVG